MKTTKNYEIQHSGNVVFAVMAEDGPAVYPSLDDACEAIGNGTVEVHEGDREYYDGRDWLVYALKLSDLVDEMPVDGEDGRPLLDAEGTEDSPEDYEVQEFAPAEDGFHALVVGPSEQLDLVVANADGARIYRNYFGKDTHRNHPEYAGTDGQ